MTKFDFPSDPWRIAMFGDWHEDWRWAEMMIEIAANLGADVCIHTGDFGINWDSSRQQRFISSVHRALRKREIKLLFVDGNHECFDALLSKPVNDFGVRPITTTIAHLPRGFRWTWWGTTWLALGGAQSVNAHQLTPRVDWWAEEVISWDQAESVISGGKANVMVTHDAPDKVDIPGIPTHSRFPAHLIRASEDHRTLLGTVVDAVSPELLLHGHMHTRHTAERTLPDGNSTTVIGLDCNGSVWRKNMILLDGLDLSMLPLHESIALPRDYT